MRTIRPIRSLRLIAIPPAVALLGLCPAAPATAGPPQGEGLQTSVCDNGQTYVFTIRERGNEEHSQALQHSPAFTLERNTVLQLISGRGTVTVTEGSEVVAAFPFTFENARRPASGKVTTCTSVYEVTRGPVQVRVESVDVLHVPRP